MITPQVGIVTNYILNNTGIEWYEFQKDVRDALKKTSLHCLPTNKIGMILKARQSSITGEYYEIWGQVRDYQLDIAIIKVNKPEEE